MSMELLTALERLEREKGISKEVLFAAIESALTSAAVKIIGERDVAKEDITVKVNKETGDIKVYKGDEEVKSEQFGRIAAQTAKQVIIQKIREAERDVISEKYLQMEGSIISGSVHRFEKGNIIIELSDTEAILPKSEQMPRERFRQGEIIRAYLLKVEKKTGGVHIIMSRSNPGFIKKLFELEVPEISQGIVGIKAVAREAGERTKIAVYSKEEKIDAVGACVGMRGSRVKEIVKELSGERIDIVRWSDDIREYVKAAVGLVEIYNIEIDRENKEVKLTVSKDQLALLIGKKGRNIRLASRLLGWELKAEAVVVVEGTDIPISKIPDIDEETIKRLEAADCSNVSQLLELDVEGLAEIEGITEEVAEKLITVCGEAMEDIIREQEEAGEAEGETVSVEEEAPEEAGEEEGGEEVAEEPEDIPEKEGAVEEEAEEDEASEEPEEEETEKTSDSDKESNNEQ